MRYKILLVIPTLDRCGAEKQLTLLASGLPRDRFEVRVAVLTRSGPYFDDLTRAGVRVDVIGKSVKASPRAYFKLKSLIREFRPDVVHTWLFAANAYGRKAAIALKTPVVICGERCVDPWKGRLHDWIDRRLARKTDAFAVNSEGIVDFYVKRGLSREKFSVVPNAIEAPPQLTASERIDRKREILQELGLPTSARVVASTKRNEIFEEIAASEPRFARNPPILIGLVARLWKQKRIDEALWAADQLKFSRLNYYLLVIGDGPERDALLRYREDIGLRDRVLFLGERGDVARFMPAFDLLWNCSAYEGQSNSILEALSFGVPVMASDIPGNRDIVTTGVNGLLISEFDGDKIRRRTAFARETLRLLRPENASLFEQMRRNARETILANFSLEKMISRYAELYVGLIQKKSR